MSKSSQISAAETKTKFHHKKVLSIAHISCPMWCINVNNQASKLNIYPPLRCNSSYIFYLEAPCLKAVHIFEYLNQLKHHHIITLQTWVRVSEVLPLAKDGIFDGINILCRDPINPISGRICLTKLYCLQDTNIKLQQQFQEKKKKWDYMEKVPKYG